MSNARGERPKGQRLFALRVAVRPYTRNDRPTENLARAIVYTISEGVYHMRSGIL
jgi:hypothetical protein